MPQITRAANGTISAAKPGTASPSTTRDGYHAISPAGTIVTNPTSSPPGTPSSGNGAS
jgi:hypothetical protein